MQFVVVKEGVDSRDRRDRLRPHHLLDEAQNRACHPCKAAEGSAQIMRSDDQLLAILGLRRQSSAREEMRGGRRSIWLRAFP